MALSFSQSLLHHHRPLFHLHGNHPSAPQSHYQPMPTITHLLKSLSLSCSSTFNDETRVTIKTGNRCKTLNNPLACRATKFGGQESDKSYVEAYAVGRYIRMSADKARRVIDQIRGRSYEETIMILELMPYRACEAILKIVFSAAANASHNLGLNKGSLIISRCEVNEGPTMKRVRPRAQGRAYPIRKRTCHITVVVKGLASEPQVPA